MSNNLILILSGNDNSVMHINNALISVGMKTFGQMNCAETSFQFSPDDLGSIILALVGSGGLVTAVSSYFKYRTKQFSVKINQNKSIEVTCSNLSDEELKNIVMDIKELVKELNFEVNTEVPPCDKS